MEIKIINNYHSIILKKYSDILIKSEYIEYEYEYMTHNFHEYKYEYFKNVLEYSSTRVLSTSVPGLYYINYICCK